jgi:hypothetical protein
MTLYNLKSADGQWRITKFTNDLDVESSYILSETECECPAGSRPTCRHRQMLPIMLANSLEDSGGFYDFENEQVLVPTTEAEAEPEVELTGFTFEDHEKQVDRMADIARPHPSIGPIKRRI